MLTRMFFGLALIALTHVAAITGDGNFDAAGQTRRKQESRRAARYICPMHPEVINSKPGKCHKCGMDLRLEKDAKDAVVTAGAGDGAGAAPLQSSQKIPDIPVYDQDGRPLKFYTDLVKNRVVAINFIFTTCTTICPPLTATFRRVQQDLKQGPEQNVQLISISIDPTVDTPERLRDFAAKFKAEPGWTFVTGEKDQIDSLLRALGAAFSNKNDHTPMVLVGNDANGHWTRTYGLAPPATIVKVITDVANHK